MTDPGTLAYNAGDDVDFQVQAATSTGTLTYAASGLPSGLSISSSTGEITGTLGSGLSAGVYSTTLTVDDGTDTSTETLSWVISPASAVVVALPSNHSNNEGATPTLSISTSYSGSGTLLYSAAGLPPGVTIDSS